MSNEAPEIINLESFIETTLPNGYKINSYNSKYLTKPGDNYGSIMIAVTANVENINNNNKKEIMHFVAKIPPRNDVYFKIFQPQRTCPAENSIYLNVKQCLTNYQKQKSVQEEDMLDVLAKCFGARLSLDSNSEIVDKNALLVLENLITDGYKVVPRTEGFDYESTLFILKNLAKFHAIPIAVRNEYPEEFEEKIHKHLKRFDMMDTLSTEEKEKFIEGSIDVLKTLVSEEDVETARDLIKLNEKYMSNKLEEDTLWNTISHYDFWVNNIMIKFDHNNKPLKMRIVDFQTTQYESLANDVIFFLMTSSKDIEKYDEFLKYYYDEFIASLKIVKYSTEQYSFEKFLAEIERIAPIQFVHILLMLKVVFMKQEALPESFDDMNLELMENKESVDETYFNRMRKFINEYKRLGYFTTT